MPKVLFVDDEEHNLSIFESLLENADESWESRTAKDGEEAKQVLNEWACDLLVTDLRMPNFNGLSLLEYAKDEYPDLMRIVLSGCAEKSLLERADQLSHARLEKPCRLEDIKQTLDQCHRFNSEANN